MAKDRRRRRRGRALIEPPAALVQLEVLADEALKTARQIQDVVAQLRSEDTVKAPEEPAR